MKEFETCLIYIVSSSQPKLHNETLSENTNS